MKPRGFKKIVLVAIVVLVFSLIITSFVLAENENPVLFNGSFTVTNEGGKFQVGFVEIDFKKNSLPDGIDSITFNAQIYAENGDVYIEFSPDAKFKKDVHLRCLGYEGYIYDRSAGINIFVKIKKQQLKTDHFSRFIWAR
ncbi:hypothetical protein Calow_1587 [Caldicellulosiruptor owensensis OL]|uniref:Uncharacterized protein n=1 Tax=Caldicellulosiruptor owensensis (strain ATCC 700167 / DSM 13100 / OL) TaxID=632518 RepID=E4Q3Q3_CALOW|nr:hypothetical protein [Caldicellulosiruptor owensensis]ADQ05133.1 hypothetical protein Calow_1587 [Caldicellulosiruptor owensensis OL]